MEQDVLKTEPRSEVGKGAARRMRRGGRIPGVLYGKDLPGGRSYPLTVERKSLQSVLGKGEQVVMAEVSGGPAAGRHQVLVREVQRHPLSSEILHFDLQAISAEERIELRIPVELKGTAKGQQEGGVIEQHIHELRIECTPQNVPEHIVVDISQLELYGALHVSEIAAPEDVKLLDLGDTVIVSCRLPQEEEVIAPEEAPVEAAEEPEVITEKKEEEKEPAEKEE